MTTAAVAIVRASALRSNLQAVRAAAPGSRVMAVVKANAYGHGLVAVARTLADADAFAVARLEEAVQLRDAGISGRIVILGGFVTAEEVDIAGALRLDLVVHSEEQVTLLASMVEARRTDIWLKVDTGMGRLGLDPPALEQARQRLQSWLNGGGTLRLLTHLASAEQLHSSATREQMEIFRSIAAGWGGVSVANSAAILQWRDECLTDIQAVTGEVWVRPGLMLYGASPLPGRSPSSLGLRPAMSFESRLIAVKALPRGRRVGYGGDWLATRDSIIGVAAAGYADGYPWHIAVNTPVMLHGIRVPVVGRVSMDMISIDLTDHPGAKPGDRLVLWGDDPPVEQVAACAGTIPYALLAGMSPRVLRQMEN